MKPITISSKYEVVIPKEIRERLNLKPGQQLRPIVYGDGITLIPVRPVKEMRGFLRGIDTDVPRPD